MSVRSVAVLVALGAAGFAAQDRAGQTTLPISTRSFLTGTTATVDRTGNPAAALLLSREVGTVTMLWTEPNGVGLCGALFRVNPAAGTTNYEAIRRMGLIPVVNLNPWTIQAGKGIVRNDGSGERRFDEPAFVGRLVEEAAQVAQRFRPRYFSIGNEINSVYAQLGNVAFDGLVHLEKELYRAIKKVSPETRVVVVLSYSQLVDANDARWYRIPGKLEGCCDILGLTSYPWKRYAKPSDLPDDYYRRLLRHWRKPVAFTEIGWSSDEKQGGSEEEQAEFLVCFLERTRGMTMEFVNWAFLHDLPESAVGGLVVQRTHLGLGLRRYDGSPKKVWHLFRALARLPESRSTGNR